MILQLSYYTFNCPICGRPVEVQADYISRGLACGHCGGQFVVYSTEDGGLTAAAHGRIDLLEQAEQLLRRRVGRVKCDSSESSD